MRLELTGRHLRISPTLRRLITVRVAHLERRLDRRALSAQVVLARERQACRADVTLHARGERLLHGHGRSRRWDTALGEALDRIMQQAERVKGKWQRRRRRQRATAPRAPRQRDRVVP
jgi:ribosomal subunit interface protein